MLRDGFLHGCLKQETVRPLGFCQGLDLWRDLTGPVGAAPRRKHPPSSPLSGEPNFSRPRGRVPAHGCVTCLHGSSTPPLLVRVTTSRCLGCPRQQTRPANAGRCRHAVAPSWRRRAGHALRLLHSRGLLQLMGSATLRRGFCGAHPTSRAQDR